MLKKSLRTGFSFGLTSGIITTLGLIVGLNEGTSSRVAILGGILTIAIADAFSDAFGILTSQEAENHTIKQAIYAMVSTFLAKFIFALSFIIPVVLFELPVAMLVSIIWAYAALTGLAILLSQVEKKPLPKIVISHWVITTVVIIATYISGKMIATLF